MAGICGFVGLNDDDLLNRMSNALSNRGIKHELVIDKDISLCSRFHADECGCLCNEDESVWISFDGELYNTMTLKQSLKDHHKFKTSFDAEVILHLYEKLGPNCVKELRGSFAYVIWDKKRKEIILARDQCGLCKLYFSCINGNLFFASEIKSLLQYEEIGPALDLETLDYYFLYGHVPGQNTLFRGIKRLIPAGIIKYRNGKIDLQKYWTVDFSSNFKLTEDGWCKVVYDAIADSVRVRLQKQRRPFGILLSGGLDSSTVASFMKKLSPHPVKSFTLRYEEEKFNEQYSRIIADHLGLEYIPVDIYAKDSIRILLKLASLYDDLISEPFVTLPSYVLLDHAKKHVKTLFTGDGGDEIFWGYPELYGKSLTQLVVEKIPIDIRTNFILPMTKKIPKFMKTNFFYSLKHSIEISILPNDFKLKYVGRLGLVYHEKDLQNIYATPVNRNNDYIIVLEDLQDYKFLDDLTKRYYVWRKCMHTSAFGIRRLDLGILNIRAPFMDHKLQETVAHIPWYLKQPSKYSTKYILRKTILKYNLLPKEIVKQKKVGMASPLHEWLKEGELKEYVSQTLLESTPHIINREYVKKLLRKDSPNHIFTMLMFVLWYNRFFDTNNYLSVKLK